MLKAKEYKEQKTLINGFPIRVTTYRIGETFHCHVANIDPGATITRSVGKTYEEAEQYALKKASERLISN